MCVLTVLQLLMIDSVCVCVSRTSDLNQCTKNQHTRQRIYTHSAAGEHESRSLQLSGEPGPEPGSSGGDLWTIWPRNAGGFWRMGLGRRTSGPWHSSRGRTSRTSVMLVLTQNQETDQVFLKVKNL